MRGGPLITSCESRQQVGTGESMNAIQVQCDQCKRRFAAKPQLAGKRVKCPGCGSTISVPDVSAISSVQVTCSSCQADFPAQSSDVGSVVACPSCGTITTVGATGGDVRSGADDSLFADMPAPTASPFATGSRKTTFQLPVQTSRFGAMAESSDGSPLLRWGVSGVAVLAGLISLVVCLVAGRPVSGVFLLLVGWAIVGCGFAYPPPKRKSHHATTLSAGTLVASGMGIGLFIALFLLVLGRVGTTQRVATPAELVGPLLMQLCGLLLLAGAMIGFVYLVIRFGFSRPASAYYSLSAIALALAWSISAPRTAPRADLPRTAQEVPRPTVLPTSMPNLGPARTVVPGVDFREVLLPVAGDKPGHAGKLYVFLPQGSHAPKSLPCVFIAPAGAISFTGMGLGAEDQREQIPYAEAGFVVVAYEIDGQVPDTDNPTDSQILEAIQQYWASGAGMVNARNAIEFALAKIPEVDPHRLYTAGHSSAGIQSLLLAENDARIKGCLAYAPVVDLASHVSEALPIYRQSFKDFDTLLKLASPREGESRLRCPVFLFHAMDDDVVPVSESTGLADRLQREGRTVDMKTASSGGHYDSMISQGIPAGIAWLKRISGAKSSPTAPGAGLDWDALAKTGHQPSGLGGSTENPFEEIRDGTGKGRDAAEKIKELLASGKRPSAEEVRNIVDGMANDGAEDAKEEAGTDVIDENPFTDAESPFEPADDDTASAGMAASARNDTEPTSSGGASSSRIKQLVDQVASSNAIEKRDALKELANIDPPADAEDASRQAVIAVLNRTLLDDDHFTQKETIEVLSTWGDKSSVEVLLSLLADQRSRSLNKDIYHALGRLKDPSSTMAIAERLGDFFDRDAAEACLREIGSASEEALLIVAPSNDAETSLRAVRLLGDVGTEKCLAMLRQALRSRNPAVKEAGRMALRKVQLRQNSAAKSEDEEADE